MKKSGPNKSHAPKASGGEKKSASGKAASSQTKPAAHSEHKGDSSKHRPKAPAVKSSSEKQGRNAAPSAPPPVLRREPTAEEIQHKKNMAQFEHALKTFNQGDFGKARDTFEHLTQVAAQDLAQRARVYLNICNQKLSQPVLKLKTADDLYNYGVSMANQGNQEEAEIYLNKALKLAPQSDYIYYALATTQALRENVEGALENLQKAIELNGKNRFLAQNDSDFTNLGEDPRFTELIYPEKPIS